LALVRWRTRQAVCGHAEAYQNQILRASVFQVTRAHLFPGWRGFARFTICSGMLSRALLGNKKGRTRHGRCGRFARNLFFSSLAVQGGQVGRCWFVPKHSLAGLPGVVFPCLNHSKEHAFSGKRFIFLNE
jgi:hypothetical protein